MNKILLVGRLVKDPEFKTISEEKNMARFILAVGRNYKEANGEKKADFIPVSVWGRKAIVVRDYLKKGNLVTLGGRLKTSSYEDESGNKRHRYEVVAEDFKIIDYVSKKQA